MRGGKGLWAAEQSELTRRHGVGLRARVIDLRMEHPNNNSLHELTMHFEHVCVALEMLN